jgi:glycerol-3-phosphate dehydrogenase (NAD(P)+)
MSTARSPASILVLGAGSWGSALGFVLARNGSAARLWDNDGAHVAALAAQRCNTRHLPGIPFPDLLTAHADFGQALRGADHVVVAVPCDALREALDLVQSRGAGSLPLCLASKGIEPGTLKLNHEIARDCLGDVPVAVLSGPSFAAETARGLPTAVAVASRDAALAARFAELFHGGSFRVYTNDDLVGVQVGGAVKNVMAIAAGIADGLGYGANTRAALITRGLAEITRLGVSLGGRPDTFTGLSGLGDLVLTCTDDQSRNRRFGLALARGTSHDEASRAIGQAIEGMRTAEAIWQLGRRQQVEMPICEMVHQIIAGQVLAADAVRALLGRGRKPEPER